jgi:RNA polymerase primary sigma factor
MRNLNVKILSSSAERTENILALYVRKAKRYPLLTFEQEQQLGVKILEAKKLNATPQAFRAKEEAKQELINANLLLVVKTIYKCFPKTVKTARFMDFIQEGNLGLLHAAENFDYRRGSRFSTYAIRCITYRIWDAISKESGHIRLPKNMLDNIHKLQKIAKIAEMDYPHRWTLEDYAKYLGVSTGIVRTTKNAERLQRLISLDAPLANAQKNGLTSLGDLQPDNVYPRPEDVIINIEFQDDIQKHLAGLKPIERKILEWRFGLNNRPRLTLGKLGKYFGITYERVHQLERRALRKLRTEILRDYYEK